MKNSVEKKTLKKRLGYLKYKLTDCWPHVFNVRRAARVRNDYRNLLDNLPPLTHRNTHDIEVHMLCGRAHLDMGIWASWSLMRFLPSGFLYVHSDGTLHVDDIAKWKDIIPSMELITKEDAHAKALTFLKDDYPHVSRWRDKDWCGCYLVDFHLYGRSRNMIIMDADVLCFSDPLELKKNIQTGVCCWNNDITNAYAATPDSINELLSIKLPNRFNAGFCMVPRMDDDDFVYLESVLKAFEDSKTIDVNHLWSSQTYLAIIAARKCNALRPLPSGYEITRGKTKDQTVVRHYVGIPSIRPRYFLEGVPRLLKDSLARASKP